MANFLNKLETEHFVSKIVVEKICEELLAFSDKMHKSSLLSLKTQLIVR